MKKEHREKALQTVIDRCLKEQIQRVNHSEVTYESIIRDTYYEEKKRLNKEKSSRWLREEKAFWKKIKKTFYHLSEEEQKEIIQTITQRYTEEIMGGFSHRVQKTITKIIPYGLKVLLERFSPFKYIKGLSDQTMDKNLEISGPVEKIKELSQKGTLIMVPTHQSNFDSIAIGYALFKSKLPPVIYGAGINLFSNPVISFLMSHLGAYTVDRKKKNRLYKEVLKTYATLSMEWNYHNLFFPGGTRNRSGQMESHLKLGLLGCGFSAYTQNIISEKENPNLYVIPCTINYGLCLEAETLIEDHLKETGQNRYIILDDESNQPFQIWKFLKKITRLNSKIHIRYGEPLDIFGNNLDNQGNSIDKNNRSINIVNYLLKDHKVQASPQRDSVYIKHLGKKITQSFSENNVIMSTHITAFVAYELFQHQEKTLSLFQLMARDEVITPKELLFGTVSFILERLNELQNQKKIILDSSLLDLSSKDTIMHGIKQFLSFYGRRVLLLKGKKAVSKELKILYYYHNKLAGYGLERDVSQWLKNQSPS